MKIKTLFRCGSTFEPGEVEVHLMPGIPHLHIVGLPDASMRESGIRLKAALRSCRLRWPRGHQVVVNLRPASLRKSSAGIDLAIALGFLGKTGQLGQELRQSVLDGAVVYGEVTLGGDVVAPPDLALALSSVQGGQLLTGQWEGGRLHGEWWEVLRLGQSLAKSRVEILEPEVFWRRPEPPPFDLHPEAAELLAVVALSEAHVLVAGPQGSGKSTWARQLFALTSPPSEGVFGEVHPNLQRTWRPLEEPHHSATVQAMIGGGAPLKPGAVSRAHGGMLILDEFLEFHPRVIEALREPLETGQIEIARRDEARSFPARFQLVATTNLCPCGQLSPQYRPGCGRSLLRCRSVCERLSGPLLDRFDLLIFSHTWLKGRAGQVPWAEVYGRVEQARSYRKERGVVRDILPDWSQDLGLSHRRGRSLLRLARAFADLDRSLSISLAHWQRASKLCIGPMTDLARLFG